MTPYEAALAELDALYARLPRIDCQRLCALSCGVIVMSRLEWIRITRRLGFQPKGKRDLACPMLKKGACSVHSIRPTVCRLWGFIDTDEMRCRWGCVPERWMTEEEGYDWLNAVEMISQTLWPGTAPAAWAHGVGQDKVLAYIAEAKGER